MKMNSMAITLAALLGACTVLNGCGGSSGGTSAAAIDDTNSQDLAVAATEGAKQATSGETAASTFGFKGTSGSVIVQSQFKEIATASAMPQDFSSACPNGGSAILDIDANGNGTFSYNMCDSGFLIIDGSSSITSSVSGSTVTTTISTNGLTFTYGSVVENYDYSITCVTQTSPMFSSECSYSSSALGFDGRTYTISNASVTGDSSSGYSVTATITDPDHGSINITTDIPVTFNCGDGRPNAGQITVSSGGDSLTVTYNSCSSFTVTFNSVATLYNWADI